MRWSWFVFVGILACDTPVQTGGEGRDAVASGAATSPATRGAGTATVRPGASPQASAPSGSERLVLSSGASLAVPSGAKSAAVPSSLPPEVKTAFVLELPGDARLMVNELAHEGEACASALEKEWTKMKAAQGDMDPERLKYRKMGEVERVELGGRTAIYGASSHSTGVDGEVASLATLVACAGEDELVAMLAERRAEGRKDAKEVLFQLVKSYMPR